jgi:hypothetical protein
MTDAFDHNDAPRDFDSVESLIHAACGYVQPTDDLRPRTLEAARAACRQRRSNYHFGCLAIVVVLLALCGFPHGDTSSETVLLARVSTSIRHFDLQQQASLRVLQTGLDPGWAFFEAFSELRRKQADLFDSAM